MSYVNIWGASSESNMPEKKDTNPFREFRNVKTNVSLSEYSWFRTGGPADYFAEVGDAEKLIALLGAVKKEGIPLFILGGGSNLLFSDAGFRGMVIKVGINYINIEDNHLLVGAGEELIKVMGRGAGKGLGGWDGLYGIPGTIGGAVRGNVGAYGSEIGMFVEKVTFYNQNLEREELNASDLNFRYRHSIFKDMPWVITDVRFSLSAVDSKEVNKRQTEIMEERNRKHPNRLTAGCFFKNPKEQGYSAAYLIESSGLKGREIGGAMVSHKHANFIINYNNATSAEILSLSKKISDEVADKTGIILEEEVEIVPERL